MANIHIGFKVVELKAKLNYGADLVSKINKMLGEAEDLTREEELNKIRDFCFDVEDFLRES